MGVESTPIIQQFCLTKINASFPLFGRETIFLAQTGVGPKRVNKRLPDILSYFEKYEISRIYNIGVAGGNPLKLKMNQLYHVNRVIQDSTQLAFTLGTKLDLGLEHISLTTVEKEVREWTPDYLGLVDMEAWDIVHGLKDTISLDKITIIKIVSDLMDLNKRKITMSDLQNHIQKNMNIIETIILNG